MVRLFFAFLCVLSWFVPNVFADQGLESSGQFVRDIDSLVDGAAVVILVRSRLRKEELPDFAEVMRIVDKNCAPPVMRHDGKVNLSAAVVVFCVHDANDLKRHDALDRELKNVTIVAPQVLDRFLEHRELKFESRSIEIVTRVDEDGALCFSDERKTCLPLPVKNSSRRAIDLETWNHHFEVWREHFISSRK